MLFASIFEVFDDFNWQQFFTIVLIFGPLIFGKELWKKAIRPLLEIIKPTTPSKPRLTKAIEPTDCTLGELVCCLDRDSQAEWDAFRVMIGVAERHIKQEHEADEE